MFVSAIECVKQYTRPILSIARNYGSTVIHPGASTLFFVNSDGWALTCGHVARQLLASGQIAERRRNFLSELDAGGKAQQITKQQARRKLERKFGYSSNELYEVHNRFIDCIEGDLDVEVFLHPNLDLAMLHFKGDCRVLCTDFPVFAAHHERLRPGLYLCRLGYPFVQFSNYEYDANVDELRWTADGRQDSPMFPSDGMVTRLLVDDDQKTVGFEMSTPGLRGQSGGPAFDSEGKVWGMQVSTLHLDLDFDVDTEVMRNGKKARVRDSAFLHVGRCLHVSVLQDFMAQHGVVFQTS